MPLIAPNLENSLESNAQSAALPSHNGHAPAQLTQTLDLSVVILNWNARDYLVAALDSLVRQNWRQGIEVIVVDNHSLLDDSAAMVRRDFPQARLIENARNIGFSAGNNVGARVARGRYVLFLNPDTIVHDAALDILVDWMDAHPEVGACGPKLLNSDGTLQPSCRAFPSFGAGLFRNTLLGRFFPNNPWSRGYLMQDFQHDKEQPVDWLSGSALLVRRAALDAIGGGWDENYFMYCEDVDLCYRLKSKGWPRFYVPQATITHRIGGSSDWAQGAMIRRHHASMLRFYFKHYARGAGLLLAPLAILGVAVRASAAVVKLYYRYFQSGRFGAMLKKKFNR